jgi:LmbE family N-acetylglucosaminyl deacetylase
MTDFWRARLESLPLLPPPDPGGKIVVLSAHPDDEVLAVGGWLSTQTDREVVFVTATDGEGSHPGSTSMTPDELRARRPGELLAALRELGFVDPDVRRLGLADGSLSDCTTVLEGGVASEVKDADLVLAPFEHDGHPDHDALGRAAIRVVPSSATLWRFPIWTWAWTEPGTQPWMCDVRRLSTTSVARHRKRRAIAAFTTQVRPVGEHPADAAVVDGTLLRHATHAPEAVIA